MISFSCHAIGLVLFEVLSNVVTIRGNKEILFVFDNFLLIVTLVISQASPAPSYGNLNSLASGILLLLSFLLIFTYC